MQPSLSVQSRSAAAARAQATQAILFALLIVIATLAVYSPVNHYDFMDVDDDAYITHNPHLNEGLDWAGVKWAFATYDLANWHPLTWLSHGLDCRLFGLDPGGHHDMNVALHALDAVLLFWVLLSATGYVGRSAMVAALFALHPINVESVVWISERKNVLSMLFFLLALGAWRWYASHPQVGRYLLVALLFALSLMAKPQAITLPFVLLLWDYWPLHRMFAGGSGTASEAIPNAPAIPPRKFSWLVVEKLPLLALSAGSAILTLQAQRAGGAMTPLNSYPLSLRLENAIVSYARYLGKAFWPSRLAPFYPYPRGGFSAWQVCGAAILLLGVTALVLRYSLFAIRSSPFARGVILGDHVHTSRELERNHKGDPISGEQRKANSEERMANGGVLVGWLWFLGTLVPMIGLVQVGDQSLADRYAYLPFIGLFIMVCWGSAGFVFQRIKSNRAATLWLALPGLAILLVLLIVTHRQIGFWRNSITLWSHAAQVTKGNDAAEIYWAGALMRQGDLRAAMAHYQKAIAVFPESPKPYMFLGYALQQTGDLHGAITQYQRALDVSRNYGKVAAQIRAATLLNMAYAYHDLGDSARAEQCLEEAQRESQQ